MRAMFRPAGRGLMDRRTFLRLGLAAVAAPTLARLLPDSEIVDAAASVAGSSVEEVSIAELQARMESGQVTAEGIARAYLARIDSLDRGGPRLRSVLTLNPDALAIAASRDRERGDGHVRGPLHGIPVLLKDNIDTADRMMTTAGSLALVGSPAVHDATVAARLRNAGAVFLGKTNLSEWANMRSYHASSGWSGRGGQTRNPYVLDRNPGGSSSGSAAAVSASLAAAALGTETDGSIVKPANNCGVVGIKPTVGLTSRAGVVPIAHSQDTVGIHGRTVADAATVLGALVGVDPRDDATAASAGRFHTDYRPFLDVHGLHGARIGVERHGVAGYGQATDAVFDAAISAMRKAGAEIVDPANIPDIDAINAGWHENVVQVYEFKRDLDRYLAARQGVPIRTLTEAIAFNRRHASLEMRWFGQEWFTLADSDPYSRHQYAAALSWCRSRGGRRGIDAVLDRHGLDAIVAPTAPPAWVTHLAAGDPYSGRSAAAAAICGYPIITVPAGHAHRLPLGISFIGTAFSEPLLIRLASGFEAVTAARRKPRFQPS